MHAVKIPSVSSFDKLMTGSIQKGRCEKIACMVYHVIPAEAGIQDPQGDMNILDSGDPVQHLISPPLVGGDKGEGETMKLKNMLHLLHPHPRPPPSRGRDL
jgi:hypothetical protein